MTLFGKKKRYSYVYAKTETAVNEYAADGYEPISFVVLPRDSSENGNSSIIAIMRLES